MVHFCRQLDTVGDGSGDKDASGNYSGAPTKFLLDPGSSRIVLARMLIYINDSGSFDANSYGNGISLTNGITVSVEDDNENTMFWLTDEDDPVKTNSDWGKYAFDVDVKPWGAGPEILLARWTFSRFGQPLSLNPRSGSKRDRLVVTLNDNFSGLNDHRFTVQGMA